MKTIALDLHGIIYTHTSGFDIEKSTKRWWGEIQKYSKKPAFRGLLKDDRIASDRLALRVEADSLERGLKDKSYLQMYFMPRAVARSKEVFSPRNKIIICSNALIREEKLIISKFLKAVGIHYPLRDIDFHNVKSYGDKKDSATWEKIFAKYKHIDEVYEDSKNNIGAVRAAARRRGFDGAICETSL